MADYEVAETAVVYPGTVIGPGAKILDHAVVGKQPSLSPRSTATHEQIKGPTIRRGARVGGGAVLCPGVEIGAEAFVGAGAVVTKDVPPRTVVVGNPARVLREVPDEELLDEG